MKIVHVIFSLNIGGAECMLVDIINEQAKSNKVALIIVNDLYDQNLLKKINTHVQVYRIKRIQGSKSLIKLIKYNFIINYLNPDVIHAHQSNILNLIWLFKKVRKVLTLHTVGITDESFYKFDKLICISKTVEKELILKNNNKISLCENGLNTTLIKVKNNYTYNQFRLIQVGSLIDKIKGQSITINALELVIKEYKYTNITLDFIGDGPSKELLRELVIKKNLENYVNFLGLKDRDWIFEHLKDYDLQVHPSIYEGFGLVVAEGMAAKLPIIVSDTEGPFEIIESGKFGDFFESHNYKELSIRIIRIIQDYGSQKMMLNLEYARNHVLKNYSIKSTVEKYYTVYKS